jgi:hypothetical protein
MQSGMKSGQKILCNLSAKAQGTRDTAIFFSAFISALRISALKIKIEKMKTTQSKHAPSLSPFGGRGALYFFLLLPLCGLGGLSSVWAQTTVKLDNENFNESAVTFTVTMGTATPTWVFVEYTTHPHNPASMSRATFTEVKCNPVAACTYSESSPSDANGQGFWVIKSAVVSATLTKDPGMFSWCAYAINVPPNAEVKAEGGYKLFGTPPFSINNDEFFVNSDELGAGTCITSISDLTYNPAGFLRDPPMTVTANAPATWCAESEFSFMASPVGSITNEMNYTWSIVGAGTTTTATTPDNPYTTTLATANTDPYTPYTYTVYVTNANGCTSTVSEARTITVYAIPVIEDVSSATICSGLTAALSATASNVTDLATYTWYVGDYSAETTTTSTYTTPALTATASTNVTYMVQITNATGCTSTVAMGTITVNSLPVPAFLSHPTAVYPNNQATFTAYDADGSGGSYCFTFECSECVRNPFLTGLDVPAAAHCLWDSKCDFVPENTYLVTMPDAGIMTVSVEVKNQYECTSATSTEVLVSDAFTPPFTETYGTLTWSGALRKPVIGCTSMSALSDDNPLTAQYKADGAATYGYYYNWACVENHAGELCPSPWRVPTKEDFDILTETDYSILSSAWGFPGYAMVSNATVTDEGSYATFWSATPRDASTAYTLDYSTTFSTIDVAYLGRSTGAPVRCVMSNE